MDNFDNHYNYAIDIDGDGFAEQPASEHLGEPFRDPYHDPAHGVQFAKAQLVFDDPQAHTANFATGGPVSDNPLNYTSHHDPALLITDDSGHIHHETNILPHQYGDVDYNQIQVSDNLGIDLDNNGISDNVEVHDINNNMVPDQFESLDQNSNGIPDNLEQGFYYDPTGDLNI